MFNTVVKYFSPLKHVPLLPHVFDSMVGIFTLIINKNIPRYIDDIEKEVSSWEGVSLSQHKYGGLQFNYRNKELGHIHSNGLLDVHFPRSVRDKLIADKEAEPHHVFVNSGWLSLYIKTEEDAGKAVQLLERSFFLKKEEKRNTFVYKVVPNNSSESALLRG